MVDTGDPIHAPCDAVIMAEDLLEQEDGSVQITDAAASWQHVRPIGEDIVAGEMLMPGYHEIRPIDIGVLLSGGITEIEVLKKAVGSDFSDGNRNHRAGTGTQGWGTSSNRIRECLRHW